LGVAPFGVLITTEKLRCLGSCEGKCKLIDIIRVYETTPPPFLKPFAAFSDGPKKMCKWKWNIKFVGDTNRSSDCL